MPSFMRNRIEVVSSASIGAARRKLWAKTWSIGPHRSIMPSIAWTPMRREAAARRLRLVGAPMGGIDEQHVGKRHRRFDVQNGAKLAGADHVAQLVHLRMEAAIVAEPERDAGLAHGRDGIFRLLLGERERLLAEHVLAGACRGNHLRSMHGMRRGQNHRIDVRIGEQRLVIRREPQTLLLGECLELRRYRAVAPATKRIASLFSADSTSVLPHQPSPTMAALIIL